MNETMVGRLAARVLTWMGAAACASAAAVAAGAAPSSGARISFDGVPGASAAFVEQVSSRLAARGATPLGWSPKGELLIATRFGETTQLHLVSTSGGERRQLTFFRDPIVGGAFSPDPWHDRFAFAVDDGGREKFRLYAGSAAGGPARPLTDESADAFDPVWSNAGHDLAFAAAAAGGGDDVDAVKPDAPGAPRVVVAGNGDFAAPLDWSPDDRRLLVRVRLAAGGERLDAVDLDSGERRVVLAPGPDDVREAKFSRDGRGVYLITARYSEFRQLRYVDLFGGADRVIAAPSGGDVGCFALSRDGRLLAYTDAQAGYDRLHLVDLSSRQELPIPPLPAPGVVGALHFDAAGKRLAFAFSTPNRPRDAYVLDLDAKRIEAWTHSEPGAADPAKLVTPEPLRFPTFDRADGAPRELAAHLYEPAVAGPHPVLILFAPRPDAAFHAGFDPWIQFVVDELQFAVLVPDLRGAAGHGRSFEALDDGSARGDVIKDIGALLVWLETRPDLDAKRVVVAGRGYGGYLALLAGANYSDRLKGIVDLSGITDLPSWLDGLPPRLQPAARAEFGDERRPGVRAFLRNLSPLALADRITKPVLIVHGRNDPRVALREAEEMTNLLRSHRDTVWLLIGADEGRRFEWQSDRDALYAAFGQFLIGAR